MGNTKPTTRKTYSSGECNGVVYFLQVLAGCPVASRLSCVLEQRGIRGSDRCKLKPVFRIVWN